MRAHGRLQRCAPTVGSNAGGTLIHVEGRGFGADAQLVFLFTSGIRAVATDQVVASSKVIVARSPEPPSGSGGTVTVEVHSDGTIASLAGGFTYTALPPT
ncbi:MAG: IPT/TIG domain-containing protein, partial [Planctomycetota bacterium]